MADTNSKQIDKPIYIISADSVEGLMAAVKRVRLKNEFLISKNALYDYYSTNSGIFAANPSISGQGGGGGDDPEDLSEKVTALQQDMSNVKTGVSNAKVIVSPIPDELSGYEDIDTITDSTTILKHAVETIDDAINS